MAKFRQQIMKGEKGQALPAVLVLLLLGGLLIAPTLGYASTSLNAGRIVEENVRGVYAADAGVENTLWYLKNLSLPPSQLPENVNQMQVEIDTEDRGKYALYYGEIIVVGEHPQEHYGRLAVAGEMVWDEEAEAYKYTITVWQPEEKAQTIHLVEVGVRLPVGYEYVAYSADSFPDNLSTDDDDELEDTLDGAGAHMLNWELSSSFTLSKKTQLTATQTFYVTGEGGQEGDYTWVKGNPSSIGKVGEVIGTLYRITARATSPGDVEPTAIVRADALVKETEGETEVEIYIISWQINPQQEWLSNEVR